MVTVVFGFGFGVCVCCVFVVGFAERRTGCLTKRVVGANKREWCAEAIVSVVSKSDGVKSVFVESRKSQTWIANE
jgi:hypothetical protein